MLDLARESYSRQRFTGRQEIKIIEWKSELVSVFLLRFHQAGGMFGSLSQRGNGDLQVQLGTKPIHAPAPHQPSARAAACNSALCRRVTSIYDGARADPLAQP